MSLQLVQFCCKARTARDRRRAVPKLCGLRIKILPMAWVFTSGGACGSTSHSAFATCCGLAVRVWRENARQVREDPVSWIQDCMVHTLPPSAQHARSVPRGGQMTWDDSACVCVHNVVQHFRKRRNSCEVQEHVRLAAVSPSKYRSVL
eukprot:gene23382-biopygen10332